MVFSDRETGKYCCYCCYYYVKNNSYLLNGTAEIAGLSLKSTDIHQVFGYQTTLVFLAVIIQSIPNLYHGVTSSPWRTWPNEHQDRNLSYSTPLSPCPDHVQGRMKIAFASPEVWDSFIKLNILISKTTTVLTRFSFLWSVMLPTVFLSSHIHFL